MTLSRVSYPASEKDRTPIDPGAPAHEIGGEIRLELSSGTAISISASRSRDAGTGRMAFGPASRASGAAPVSVDASAWAPWKPLVGRSIAIRFVDPGRQVIEVRAGDAKVYCSSRRGAAGGPERIRVSAVLEVPPGPPR